MTNYRTVLIAAAIAAAPLCASAQTQKQDATKPDTTAVQNSGSSSGQQMDPAEAKKLKDECDARKQEATAAAANNSNVQSAQKKSDSGPSIMEWIKKAVGMAPDTAEEKNDEIVANTETAPDGSQVVEGGSAKPVENWFGCPPDKTEDAKPKQ